MKKRESRMEVRRETSIVAIAVVMAILLGFAVIPVASAATLTITPSTAVSGDLVTIEGAGFTPNAAVTIESTCTCEKPVVSGKCECSLKKFNISTEETGFSLSVSEVKDNVKINAKRFWWTPYWTIDHNMMGFVFSYDLSTHTSTVTRGMPTPTGVYEVIDVIGNAVDGATTCTMTTTVTKRVTTDATGGFREVFDTHGIPAGTYTVTADGTTATLNLTTTPEMPEGADVSRDGYVGVYDCVCIARYVLSVPGYDETTLNIAVADINGDEEVDLRDKSLLPFQLI